MTAGEESPNENIKPQNPIIDLPETHFIGKTAERAYYRSDNFFIKRSLRPSEYIINWKGKTHIPQLGVQRLKNEAATLRYIRRVTNIPVPTLFGIIEIDDSFVLITEYIEGVHMADLKEEQKLVVQKEVKQYQAMLRELKSDVLDGVSGIVIPPYRVMHLVDKEEWPGKIAKAEEEFVFCHNDLSQHNIIVDPESLKIMGTWGSLIGSMLGSFQDVLRGTFMKERDHQWLWKGRVTMLQLC